MDAQGRLELDGAFKRVARAQGVVGRLAEDGVEMTMAQGREAPWAGLFERLRAARAESDAALDELEAMHRTLVPARTD